MRVESMAQFLNRKIQQRPVQVVTAMQIMVDRNRLSPRTMAELIDQMAARPELRAFAQELNERVPAEDRGSHGALAKTRSTSEIQTQASAAFDGIAPADKAINQAPEGRAEAASPRLSCAKPGPQPRAVTLSSLIH